MIFMKNKFTKLRDVMDIGKGQKGVLKSRYTRGLYFTLFREKPPEKKLLLLVDFIKNWAPFIKNSILAIFTDPKAKRSENAPNNQMQNHIKDLCCNSFIVPQLLK